MGDPPRKVNLRRYKRAYIPRTEDPELRALRIACALEAIQETFAPYCKDCDFRIVMLLRKLLEELENPYAS